MYRIIMDSLQEARRQFSIRHKVIIYGTLTSGARFEMITDVVYDPIKEEVEQAIIRRFRSSAQSFNELSIEQGWRMAQWTFTNMGI